MNKILIALILLITACRQKREVPLATVATDTTPLIFEGETHFKNIKQLTFGGDNAEAYWSFDGKKFSFQRSDYKKHFCDQIFWGEIPSGFDTARFQLASTGTGRTTCAAFMPGDTSILFASTHITQDTCPPVPDREKIGKYVWPLYPSYELFISNTDGEIIQQLTSNNFYDAEATISPRGDRIIFTSTRNGDLDLYTMNLDGSDVQQVTSEIGYDGGAWFSPDGQKIVWRASRPSGEEEVAEYKSLLKQNLVAPTHMEVFVADADGRNASQVTQLPKANWAPVFTPDGNRILFASNHEFERGFPFNLYLINLDGTGLEKVSTSDMFDAFPMFSPDGKYLMWCSNRNNGGTRETNVFIAEWIE